MDADGLPIVGPGVDFFKVQSISQKRQLSFLNHFVLHTVKFLNKFSGDCEEKLEALSIKIQKIETCLSILEAKLSSIPGLDDVKPATAANDTAQNSAITDNNNPTAAAPPAAPPAADVGASQTQSQPPVDVQPVETKVENVMTVSQDPRYAKYFKMLNVGVPPPAVKMKMSAEGLDPDLLDNPDAPAPAGGAKSDDSAADDSNSDNDSESSFSD